MINAVLRKLFVRRAPRIQGASEDALLNYSLDLAQEWGQYWLQPIQSRLRSAYPGLPDSELDRLNAAAQAAMTFAHDLVYSMADQYGRKFDQSKWAADVLAQFPWIDQKNINHLHSTGLYYAWRDGVGQ